MAAKLLHTLADDSPDLQKQIGCMPGIFHALDHRHLITGRRTTHKLITLGRPNMNTVNLERELISKYEQRGTDTNFNRTLNEKQRLSIDSSRPSFSSSCSSSLSSSELNKGAQLETSSAYDRIIFPETPSRDPLMNETNTFPHLGLQSADRRDVVRDSMYKEARGISIKTSAKEAEAARRSKRGDSPRPADLNESLRVLAKYRETKDGSRNLVTENAPRVSIDSRDGIKSTVQMMKELPRLSLDSRERVMQSPNADSKTTQELSKSLSSGSFSSQRRPPSVIAKLMGLETLPGSPKYSQLGMNKTNTFENVDMFANSLRGSILNRTTRTSPSSPRSSGRDPTSPRWKSSDIVMKPISSSRVPIEPAPWKQLDRNRVLRKPVPVPGKVSPSSVPTVYSEIEKRLKDLEFKESGKDLRALKQIMEAIQSKGFLENQKEAQSSNSGTRRDFEPKKSAIQNQKSSASSSLSSIGTLESPIVIMKPAKSVERAGIPTSSLIPIHSLLGINKHQNQRAADSERSSKGSRGNQEESARNLRSNPSLTLTDKKSATRNPSSSSARPQKVSKESGSKSLGSTSPRLQQKKTELDKRSRPPTAPESTSNSRKQSNRQMAESNSPGGRCRSKSVQQQKNDKQLGKKSNGTGTLSGSSDDLCPQSDVEVTSSELAQSAIETAKNVISGLIQNKSSPRVSKDESLLDLSVVLPQRSTPSSPVKQYAENNQGVDKNCIKKGNSNSESAKEENFEDQWNPAYSFSKTATCGSSPEINRKKLQNIEHLVQKLRRLNSTHDEASQDYIASLCENTNPNSDHRYISEILLASGLLLRDLGSGLATFQLHPSGHPINPELFLVLEQTKGNYESKMSVNFEKNHRKLVFDVVNEVLVEKLASAGAVVTEPFVNSYNATKTAMNAQQLLKELCFEIETLQIHAEKRSESLNLEEENDVLNEILREDVVIRSGKWTEFNPEISGLVLDIERRLFKDLVDEIVHGEVGSGGLRSKNCRKRMNKNIT